MSDKNKLKLLVIRDLLEKKTDSEHGLTCDEIIQYLEKRGMTAERKSICDDIKTLKSIGFDVEKKHVGRPNVKLEKKTKTVEYRHANRKFSLNDLLLMVNAVQSCHAITEEQSNDLVEKIKGLTSDKKQEEEFGSSSASSVSIYVAGRAQSQNKNVFENIDLIKKAIGMKKQIDFYYSKTDEKGKPHKENGGEKLVVTPVGIIYSDGFYYVASWNEATSYMHDYRLDRMTDVEIQTDDATTNNVINDYFANEKEYAVFGRFKVENQQSTVFLSVKKDKTEIVTNRFGRLRKSRFTSSKAENLNNERTIIPEKVYKSCQFYGWVASMSGCVQIAGNEDLLEEYRDYLLDRLKEADEWLEHPYEQPKVNKIQ